MAKVNQEQMAEYITEMFAEAKERNEARAAKKRQFIETVEIQIGLKGFDPSRDKRINAVTVLPFKPKMKYRFCLLGNAKQCEEAAAEKVPFKTQEELKATKRNKKIVKKMAKQYDAFLASSTLIKKIPRLLGPTLNKIGKFPTPIKPSEKIAEKIKEMERTVKGSLKFKPGAPMCMAFPIGNVSQTEDQVKRNLVHIINYLVSQFKKGWQNVKRIHIKTTMGKPRKIYGF
eukprot:UN31039